MKELIEKWEEFNKWLKEENEKRIDHTNMLSERDGLSWTPLLIEPTFEQFMNYLTQQN